MTATITLELLATLQTRLRSLCLPLPDSVLRRQMHPDLSPLGWHLGHCAFIETHWLREVVLGDAEATAPWQALYVPERAAKPGRGPRLPAKAELFDWVQRLQEANLQLLREPPPRLSEHSLLRDDYLPRFLCCHHAQHLETMRMALAQHAAATHVRPNAIATPRPRPPTAASVTLPAGAYRIGRAAAVCDNEGPPQQVALPAARLGRRPVSNGEFLAFIEAGGYRRPQAWSTAGDAWRQAARATAPAGWQRAGAGWYEIGPEGPQPLAETAPVSGLSWFEAEAYARWAGARLPHEYEWEAAAREGLLEGLGEVWEWCGNPFHPYPGFRAFPYAGYSTPWFDGSHYVLRGGGRHSEPCVRSVSFRNFYTRDKRHIFAGCRLAYDA